VSTAAGAHSTQHALHKHPPGLTAVMARMRDLCAPGSSHTGAAGWSTCHRHSRPSSQPDNSSALASAPLLLLLPGAAGVLGGGSSSAVTRRACSRRAIRPPSEATLCRLTSLSVTSA
jgi:hypothetical protein